MALQPELLQPGGGFVFPAGGAIAQLQTLVLCVGFKPGKPLWQAGPWLGWGSTASGTPEAPVPSLERLLHRGTRCKTVEHRSVAPPLTAS